MQSKLWSTSTHIQSHCHHFQRHGIRISIGCPKGECPSSLCVGQWLSLKHGLVNITSTHWSALLDTKYFLPQWDFLVYKNVTPSAWGQHPVTSRILKSWTILAIKKDQSSFIDCSGVKLVYSKWEFGPLTSMKLCWLIPDGDLAWYNPLQKSWEISYT